MGVLQVMIIKIPNTAIKHEDDIQSIIEHIKRNWNYTSIVTNHKEDSIEILVHHAKTKKQ